MDIFIKWGSTALCFTRNDIDDKNYLLRNNEIFIFKIHDNTDRVNSIIFGKGSYDDVLLKNIDYRWFMENIFSV